MRRLPYCGALVLGVTVTGAIMFLAGQDPVADRASETPQGRPPQVVSVPAPASPTDRAADNTQSTCRCTALDKQTGLPLAGAEVTLITDSARGVGQTADDGSLVFVAPPRPYSLRVCLAGYRLLERDVAQVTEAVVFRLDRGASIRGRVVDARTGQPVPRATVCVTDEHTAAPVDPGSVTDVAGVFTTLGVSAQARVLLAVSADGYAHESVAVNPLTTSDLTIRLGAQFQVIGIVTGSSGVPCAGAVVRVFRKESRPPLAVRCLWAHTARPLATATTNAIGEYEIRGIPAGEFSLWVRGDDGSGTVPPLTDFVVDATDIRVDAVLRSPTGLLIRDGDDETRDGSVIIGPLIHGLPSGTVFLGGVHTASGTLIAPLHPGPHRVVVDTGVHVPWWADVEVLADEVVVVTPERLRGVSASGRVADPQGRGLAGVQVSLEGTRPGEPSVSRTAWTGGDGTFVVSGLPDLLATISFDDPSGTYMSAETVVRTSLGRPIMMTLERGMRLAGRIEPKPSSSSVQCRIIRPEGDVIARTVFLDDEDKFEIRGLERMTNARVMFVDDDYRVAVVQPGDIGPATDLGVVRLAEPRHVAIRVTTTAGRPVGDAVVVVHSETWELETVTSSGPDGTCVVPWPDEASVLRVYRPSSSGRRALLERNAAQFLGTGINVLSVEDE